MSFWQPSSTLSDVWDLLFEEPYPTLSVVIQSWMCGLRSSSLPLRCPVWQFHQGGQPSRRATILTATQIHVHACHQQHHDYIMYVLLTAILPHCLMFGFEEPYPTLSVVIQCCLCGLKSSLPRRCLVWQFNQGGQSSSGAEEATSLTAIQ